MRVSKSVGWISFFLLTSIGWAAPAQVLLIRHAEKPATGNELSPQGLQRAQALVKYFETDPAVIRYGTPVAIYAMAPKDSSGSLRPIETVTPLATSLGLQVHGNYLREEIQPLVSEILSTPQYDGKMVLICWEHHMIPVIAAQFGASSAPQEWPGESFDQVWEIDFSGNSVSGFRQFSQHVLPGDS